jgi:hypothetical protein
MTGRFENSNVFFRSMLMVQMNSALEMVSSVGGLNPQPLGQESSPLTTTLKMG